MRARPTFVVTALVGALLAGTQTTVSAQRLYTHWKVAEADSPTEDTIGSGDRIKCEGNESKEWGPEVACGTMGESPAYKSGEHRCFTFYDSATDACQRKCVWTGNCED